MSIILHATFEVADIDELHELIINLRELEPVHTAVNGCVSTLPYVDEQPTFPERAWSCDRCGSQDTTGVEEISGRTVCHDCADHLRSLNDETPPMGVPRLVKEADVDLERLLDGTRECTADPCIDPLCETHGVHEWPLDQGIREAQYAMAAQRVSDSDRKTITSLLYGELYTAAVDYHANGQSRDDYIHSVDYLAGQVNADTVSENVVFTPALGYMVDLSHWISGDEFMGVVHELGRDAWGSAHADRTRRSHGVQS